VLIYQNVVSLFVMTDAIRNNDLLWIALFFRRFGSRQNDLCFPAVFLRSFVFFLSLSN